MRYMRTTLDIADDILRAAKEIAVREHSTAGAVISRLARQALLAPPLDVDAQEQAKKRNGVPVFPARPGEVITLQHVRKLAHGEST